MSGRRSMNDLVNSPVKTIGATPVFKKSTLCFINNVRENLSETIREDFGYNFIYCIKKADGPKICS